MGVLSAKIGAGGERQVVPQQPAETRSSSILGRLSGLLHRLGVGQQEASKTSAKFHGLDPEAIRQRMTPPDEVATANPAAVLARRGRTPVLPFVTSPTSKRDRPLDPSYPDPEASVSWPGESVPDWKPVLRSSGEMPPVAPAIDDLVNDPEPEPTLPTFPDS